MAKRQATDAWQAAIHAARASVHTCGPVIESEINNSGVIMYHKTDSESIYLAGGVGNKLFQISRAFAHENGMVIDLQNYNRLFKFAFNWSCHVQWLDLKKLCCDLSIHYKESSFFDISILLVMKVLSKFSKEMRFFNSCFSYFQDPGDHRVEDIRKVAASVLHRLSIRDSTRPYSVVHLRGGDFGLRSYSSDAVNNIKKFSDISGANMLCAVTDDDDLFEYIKSGLGMEIKRINGSEEQQFAALCLAESICVSESTFCFWAVVCGSVNGTLKYVYLGSNNPLVELYKKFLFGQNTLIRYTS